MSNAVFFFRTPEAHDSPGAFLGKIIKIFTAHDKRQGLYIFFPQYFHGCPVKGPADIPVINPQRCTRLNGKLAFCSDHLVNSLNQVIQGLENPVSNLRIMGTD